MNDVKVHLAIFWAAFWILVPGGTSSATTPEPTYVLFQFQGIEDDSPKSAELPRLVDEIRKEFGVGPAGATRLVGFTPGLLFVQNLPPNALKARVVQALDLAEQTGMPVFFHLDDMHFWYRQTHLINDPEAVEWSAFPKKGEPHGPVVRRYWLDWGRLVVFPAPPPCFACPKFRAEVANRLTHYVAQPIVDRLTRWKTGKKEHLFAGIAVGNETQVPDYRNMLRHAAPDAKEPEGIDVSRPQTPPVMLRMRRDEMVRTGYASLHRRGYSADRIERLAKEQRKTVDEVTTELLYEVMRDYAEFRAKILYETGIPRERLYTHFTSPFRPFLARMAQARPSSLGTAGSTNLPPPVRYAVNPYSRAGFTMAPDMVDLQDITSQLAQARDKRDADRAWGVVETYVTTGQAGRPRAQSQQEFETYLGALFHHGVRVVNLYGWNVPMEAPFSVKKAPGVIRTIRNWMDGKDLPTAWSARPSLPEAPPEALGAIAAKGQKLNRTIQEWQKAQRDLTPVDKIMQEFEPLMREGKFKEAEGVLDRALDVLRDGEKSGGDR